MIWSGDFVLRSRLVSVLQREQNFIFKMTMNFWSFYSTEFSSKHRNFSIFSKKKIRLSRGFRICSRDASAPYGRILGPKRFPNFFARYRWLRIRERPRTPTPPNRGCTQPWPWTDQIITHMTSSKPTMLWHVIVKFDMFWHSMTF